ncbi:hypothetical protein EVAR_93432_1 [Eumeta japonica]|uniref:Uncharacterized protein n=1 Tax=Eumeta variegata TaxID=151549 RepID=A0A4C1UPY0_EUMVA|nr:hypothetical protein EVAR_93432_1 [Eumeta japonica]
MYVLGRAGALNSYAHTPDRRCRHRQRPHGPAAGYQSAAARVPEGPRYKSGAVRPQAVVDRSSASGEHVRTAPRRSLDPEENSKLGKQRNGEDVSRKRRALHRRKERDADGVLAERRGGARPAEDDEDLLLRKGQGRKQTRQRGDVRDGAGAVFDVREDRGMEIAIAIATPSPHLGQTPAHGACSVPVQIFRCGDSNKTDKYPYKRRKPVLFSDFPTSLLTRRAVKIVMLWISLQHTIQNEKILRRIKRVITNNTSKLKQQRADYITEHRKTEKNDICSEATMYRIAVNLISNSDRSPDSSFSFDLGPSFSCNSASFISFTIRSPVRCRKKYGPQELDMTLTNARYERHIREYAEVVPFHDMPLLREQIGPVQAALEHGRLAYAYTDKKRKSSTERKIFRYWENVYLPVVNMHEETQK